MNLFDTSTNIDWAEVKFQITFDVNEKQELKTNWDEMMFYHILPKKVGLILSLEEVADSLTTATNEVPMFIKIKQIKPLILYELLISKRFRKIAEIKNNYNDSQLIHFVELNKDETNQ